MIRPPNGPLCSGDKPYSSNSFFLALLSLHAKFSIENMHLLGLMWPSELLSSTLSLK